MSASVQSTPTAARLVSYYVSRDRVLGLLNVEELPHHVLGALRGGDAGMSSAILSGAVGSYVLTAVASGKVKTLQQHVYEGTLKPGVTFIYSGHFYGKGFAYANKSPALTMAERLDEKTFGDLRLVLHFAKDGLVNATAYSRLSGSVRAFAFAYVTSIDDGQINAAPFVIGDLVDRQSPLGLPFASTLQLSPWEIAQFHHIDAQWMPSATELKKLKGVPEAAVKELICGLLDHPNIPSDWGGEESDLFSADLLVANQRKTGAFLLKGPAKFHSMTPNDLGKNGDQLYRLFNIPADLYVIQHCHHIGPAVRRTVEAFAMSRSFTAPCKYVILDGVATAQLICASGLWDILDDMS